MSRFLPPSVLTDTSLRTYATRLLEGCIPAFSGLLAFQNPAFLAGPFGPDMGLVQVRDARKSGRQLRPYTQEANRICTSRANSAFPIIGAAKAAGFADEHTYLTGRIDPDSQTFLAPDDKTGTYFLTPDLFPDSPTRQAARVETTRCSSLEMTCLDFARIIHHALQAKGTDEATKILDTFIAHGQHARDTLPQVMGAIPTIERPYQVCVSGNDDSAWMLCLPDLDSVSTFLDALQADPTYTFVRARMHVD